MSKNIYRVNKKSDLDEIMRNNFYKPICIVFVSKLMDTKIYEEIATALMTISKKNTYTMHIIIDFDNFIDNIDYFSNIKTNLPYFLAYFKGKNIGTCDSKDNFIPLIINSMDQIHNSYVSKLMTIFNQEQHKEEEINNQENNKENNQVNNQVNEEIDEESEEEENENESEEDNEELDEEVENESINEEIQTNDSELIKREKEKLKKLKELKKLQMLLSK